MTLTYSSTHKLFIFRGEAVPPDFSWSSAGACWYTPSPWIAYAAYQAADAAAAAQLAGIHRNILASAATEPVLPAQDGLYPFQAAGVEYLVDSIRSRGAALNASEQGLGKSAEALCAARRLGFERLLVICPAAVKYNWLREIDHWHGGVASAIDHRGQPLPAGSAVVSYDLAEEVKGRRFDFIIVDEFFYLKNTETKRTLLVLGDARTGWMGLVDKTPAMFLGGTPLPNGKSSELWPVVFRSAPDVIDRLKYADFVRRFCWFDFDQGEMKIRGTRRHDELFARLRGSGFMTRHLKKDVLKDLPDKQYVMVYFPQDSQTREIIRRERQFNAAELREFATSGPVDETRQEMGLAKVGRAVEFIRDLLSSVDKAVVFAHHIEVIGQLKDALLGYSPVVITGDTPPSWRQQYVDLFQQEHSGVRVFIGNLIAAGVGITLTAASHVVFVENSWVPGENEQAADRCHRIGQKNAVTVYYLVVEGSLDAKMLEVAARKNEDSARALDGSH